MKWFDYTSWTADMKRAPRARHAYGTANAMIGKYANESGLTDTKLAEYVAKREKLRTSSNDIDIVGRALTRKLYRKPIEPCATNHKPRTRKLTRTERNAETFYMEDEDGVPKVPFDTLCVRYG